MFRLLSSHREANFIYINLVHKVYVHVMGSQSVYIFIIAVEKLVGNIWIKHGKIRNDV
jgi:hypothetical protein